jgi:membrane protease YdiL (CAAX protease family)
MPPINDWVNVAAVRSELLVFHSLCPEKVRYTHHVQKAPAIRPANWIATAILFGVPALAFAFLFHWLGPNLRQGGTSWWRIFHLLLILPLTCMFVAGAAFDQRSISWKGIKQRLRLSAPSATAWLWAAVHGISWSVFHLFMQPTLWDTIRLAITGVALSFVAQRTRSTWPGIVGHSFGNLTFFVSLVRGVTSH